MKIILIIIFILLGLYNGFLAIIGPGIAASGSGCGSDCMENMLSLKIISFIFFALAIITGVYYPKKKK